MISLGFLMRTIKLTQNKVALVDDEDYGWLNQYGWFAIKSSSGYTFYAVRYIRLAKCKYGTERMHRAILGLQLNDKRQCDHIDGNGLNNQGGNPRICSNAQNQQNMRKRSVKMTSKYKGVNWYRKRNKWRAQIRVDGKKIFLGYFRSEYDAARTYNKAALKYFRSFARTNTI